MALPEFQREFVWGPGKVAELIDSVSRGWPIGSLLLLEGPKDFSARKIEDGPPVRGKVETYILDGQQRLTALFHAVSDRSDTVYYVDFESLLAEGEAYIKWMKRKRFDRDYPDLETQAKSRIAKVCDVFDEEKFFLWYNFIKPSNQQIRYVRARKQLLPGLHDNVYQLVSVRLEKELPLDALARIFETLNRTGIRLSAFDLMVAVLYPSDFNLHEAWENAKAEFPVLSAMEVEGIEMLKLVALLERHEHRTSGRKSSIRGVRQGDVLKLTPGAVKQRWASSVAGYAHALQQCKEQYGALDSNSIPSFAMVLALAGIQETSGGSASDVHDWYWHSVALQSYSHGANTQVIRDVESFSTVLDELRTGTTLRAVEESLGEPLRRNRLLAKGVGGRLISSGALDPVTKRPLGEGAALRFLSYQRLVTSKAVGTPSATPLFDLLYLDESSIKTIRRGLASTEVANLLDSAALRSQGFSLRSKAGPTSGRARKLARLVIKGELS